MRFYFIAFLTYTRGICCEVYQYFPNLFLQPVPSRQSSSLESCEICEMAVLGLASW